MGNKTVRVGQIIAPFGPGSIYNRIGEALHSLFADSTTGSSVGTRRADCNHPRTQKNFNFSEPRLAALLDVGRFCAPPDFRIARFGQPSPPNAQLYVPALRFPRWYRNTRNGDMRRFNLSTQRIDPAPDGGRWRPVRFISVCVLGHLCKLQWKQWINCTCPGDQGLRLTDRGGSELTSVRIECRTCPSGSPGQKGKSLAGTTTRPDEDSGQRSLFQRAGIDCPGDRPWLGEDANENCNSPLIAALINQTNIYFPKTISAILLPDLQQQNSEVTQVRNEIEQDPGTCGIARTPWNMNNRAGAVALAQVSLQSRGVECPPAQNERPQRASSGHLFRSHQRKNDQLSSNQICLPSEGANSTSFARK